MRKTLTRDAQKKKLYKAEFRFMKKLKELKKNSVFDVNSEDPLSVYRTFFYHQVTPVINERLRVRLYQTNLTIRSFPLAGKGGKIFLGKFYAQKEDTTIYIKIGADLYTLVHEIAHWIHYSMFPPEKNDFLKVQGHGPEYVSILAWLIYTLFGEEIGDCFYTNMLSQVKIDEKFLFMHGITPRYILHYS